LRFDSKAVVPILEDLSNILDQLLGLSREKQQAVIQNDVSKLENVVKCEQELVSRLNHLDGKRLQIVPCLDSISEEAKRKNCDRIVYLLRSIGRKVLLLKTVNSQNQKLLEKSLQLIKLELSLLMPKEGYNLPSKPVPLLFDEKV